MSQTSTNPPEAAAPAEAEPRRHRKKLERNEITLNLVAMLDMSFNILIFFILTANFAVGEGVLTSKLPGIGGGASSLDKPPEVELKITLTPGPNSGSMDADLSNTIVRIEGDSSQIGTFKDLTTRLTQLQKDSAKGRSGIYPPDSPVMIKADNAIRWNVVVGTFNSAVAAQYKSVSFAEAAAPSE